jgi:hypothetical protein
VVSGVGAQIGVAAARSKHALAALKKHLETAQSLQK